MPYFDSPIDAEQAFYNAFRNLDIAAMQRVWADLPTVYCIHPSGQLYVGFAAVLQSWSMIFKGVEKPQLDYHLISESRHPTQVVHLVEEGIGAKSMPQESLSVVLATNVYVLSNEGWRICCHHAAARISAVESSATPGQLH